MSKKDYKLLARLIKQNTVIFPEPEVYEEKILRNDFVFDLIACLEAEYKLFDRSKFLKACGMTPPNWGITAWRSDVTV